jgi:alpha-D-glucose phosphate-specific phosphoglucomutase
MAIHFGTDGWRAVISEDFTFANVRLVAQAIADYIWEEVEQKGVAPGTSRRVPVMVVGFDTRFLSDRYAIEVACVLAANGILVYLTNADCPTPALSYAVRNLGADGGVMITASHNPPRYNGIKLKASCGGSASLAQNQRVEAHLGDILCAQRSPWTMDYQAALREERILRFDPAPPYLAHLRALLDWKTIAATPLRIVVDPMHGAGRGYLAGLLQQAGHIVREIRGEMNPGFGGVHPEPIARHLAALSNALREGEWDLGLATDGDADRIGAMTPDETFVDPHRIFALSLRHLVEWRGLSGMVVKTISTTQMVNLLADRYKLPLRETPIGFNYICDCILFNDVLIGGEESGGITIKGHIPEGDGILMGLLLVEIMAATKQPLSRLLQNLTDELGPFYYGRHDFRMEGLPPKAELVKCLAAAVPDHIGGVALAEVKDQDGMKYVLANDSWLLIRPSGTEPLLRIYAEAAEPACVEALLASGRELALKACEK